MRIGYMKSGRAWQLDRNKMSTTSGDIDLWNCLDRLARALPGATIDLIGRNSGNDPVSVGLPENVYNNWTRDFYWKVLPIETPFNVPIDEFEDTALGPIRAMRSLLPTSDLAANYDALVVWIGQHSATSRPLPMGGSSWEERNLTRPHLSYLSYCSYVNDIVNRWTDATHRPAIYLVPDPRNYIKSRDTKHPPRLPVLSQFTFKARGKFEQYGAPFHPQARTFGTALIADFEYEYAAIEMTALAPPETIKLPNVPSACPIGIISNENRREVSRQTQRALIMRDWVMSSFPSCPVYGIWSDAGRKEMGVGAVDIVPRTEMLHKLSTFKSTFMMPASGSGWLTSKLWECFAAGTVCFIHPLYDTQRNAFRAWPGGRRHDAVDDVMLEDFLCVQSPAQLAERVNLIDSDLAMRRKIVSAQRRLLERKFAAWQGGISEILNQIEIVKG